MYAGYLSMDDKLNWLSSLHQTAVVFDLSEGIRKRKVRNEQGKYEI